MPEATKKVDVDVIAQAVKAYHESRATKNEFDEIVIAFLDKWMAIIESCTDFRERKDVKYAMRDSATLLCTKMAYKDHSFEANKLNDAIQGLMPASYKKF